MSNLLPRKALIDIKDRDKEFKRLDDRTDALKNGFHGFSLEYGFYVESIEGGHKIVELGQNVIYRLFSAIFHVQLLLHHHKIIATRLTAHYLADRPAFEETAPKHREYSYAEREISSLFDSIIYHLSSVYDYMAILINFVSVKNRDKTPKWTKIVETARNNPQFLRNDKLVEIIQVLNEDFVTKLYRYRSRLIHERSDVCRILVIRNPTNIVPYFTCTDTVRKLFKKYIQEEDADYALSFLSTTIIHETVQQIAVLLEALRRIIKENSNSTQEMNGDLQKKLKPIWEIFEEHFKVRLD